MIKASSKWKPAIQDGEKVRTYMTVPITFKLD